MELSLPQLVAVYAIPVILAITLHEAAHAFVAARLGDRTAELQGRVTLNPLRHIDLVGTLLVPALILFASKALGGGGLLFGWAKPVPIVASNLRSPRRHMGVVAAAGPGANIAMAVAWALALKLTTFFGDEGEFLARMAIAGIFVNFALAALNLMPVPPLDGGRILTSLLPHRLALPFSRLEPYGMFILLALLASGLLGVVVAPLVDVGVGLVAALFSLSD
jgi:Zn-dependent protease